MSVEYEYHDDCERIVRVAAENNIFLTLGAAKTLWETVSESMAAGWLSLPDNDEDLLRDIRYYYEGNLIGNLPYYLCKNCDGSIPLNAGFCPWCGIDVQIG